jgi:hypothetical protein
VATSTGNAWGLRLASASGAVVEGNRITSADYGIFYAVSTGKYMDNLTSGVATPFIGGTDAGGNN